MDGHVLITNFLGNPNVGLYGYATDDYVLLGNEVPEKEAERISKTLKVPAHKLNIAGTSLIGVFLTGSKNKLLVPQIALDQEIETLKKLNIDFEIFKTNHTCLGNNILVNENGAVISSEYTKKEAKKLSKLLGVKVEFEDIAGTETPGSVCVANNKYSLIHRDANAEEISKVEKTLKVKATTGTVNLGSPYVKSGILANKNGFVIGANSGGPEITNADEALGYIKNE